MRTEITGGGVLTLAGVALVGGLGLWLYSKRGAIVEAAQVVNPASDKNIAYQGVNKLTQTMTGQKNTSFGSWLYDLTHPNQIDPTAPTPIRYQGSWDDIMLRRAREAGGAALNGAGWVEGIGASGQRELIPPQTPATWLLIAGASVAMYAAKKHKRRSRRR